MKPLAVCALLSCLAFCPHASGQGGIITTVAGIDNGGFSGDGGPATSAQLRGPSGIVVDSSGNLFITDTGNGRIREISVGGIINTVAGNGNQGYSGDGGQAVAASLNIDVDGLGIAVDASGNIFIADFNNNVVRKVSVGGIITTVAGNGFTAADGGGGFSGDGGQATLAELSAPAGVAVDASGNLFIADLGNNRIRKVSPGGIITTVAGSGCTISEATPNCGGFSGDGGQATSATLNHPGAIAVDASGNLYIADNENNRVRKVSNGIITTVAGIGPVCAFSSLTCTGGFSGDGGLASSASLNFPGAITVDASGNLFIADTGNLRVREVSAGGIITTVAGNGTFDYNFSSGPGAGDGGPATAAPLNDPEGVAVDASGDLFIADALRGRIREVLAFTTVSPLAIATASLPGGAVGVAYSAALAATGGIPPYTWTATGLPPGLSLNGALLSGTPTASGTFTAALSVADSSSPALTAMLTIPLTIAPASSTGGPAITSVSPSSAAAGSTSVTVTITGTGFVSGIVAQWNGLSLSTSYVNSTTLTAQIPAGDLVTQGTGQITVENPTGPASNSFPFVISASASLQLVTVAPCRVMDTRRPNGTLGGPSMGAGTSRTIPIPSGACGVPANAMAYSLNFTVVPGTGSLRSLTVWPTGTAQPLVQTLTSPDGAVLASAAIVPAGTDGSINAYVTDETDLIVDINGYFVPPAASTFQFYPLPPCRVLDTRQASGTFGGPTIAGGTSRSFPIASSSCGAPAGAAAYSLNVTVVPPGYLGYLTAWPTGQAQPFVSTMNAYDGTVIANAAIVPAGAGGAVSFYASDATDVVVDINGYFAPPGANGNGFNFYTVTPCRLVDTRNASGTFGGPTMSGYTTRNFPLSEGSCGLPGPPALQAYSLSVSVVPQGVLPYLTIWPAGVTQPVVSTLNAWEGQAVSNAALVPAGTGGSVSVFVTATTDVVIDTAGYFGP